MKKTKKNIENSSPVCYTNADELRDEFKDEPVAKDSKKKRKQKA